jgi:hypothetical protein
MEISLHDNICDMNTLPIAQALHAPFKTIGSELSGDYGGIMEHLWISFELSQR